MGGSGWFLAGFCCEDPQGCYAPPSLLNEARRQLLERLSEVRHAEQEKHRTEVLGSGERHTTVQPRGDRELTVKCALGQSPLLLPKEVTRVVLDIGNLQKEQAVAWMKNWRRAAGDGVKLLPSVPVLVRNDLSAQTDETIRGLLEAGCPEWECADLSGCHRLLRLGARPVSSDWSFYVTNPQTAEQLASFGIRSFVLSSELDEQAVDALLAHCALRPELLLFQHTPLFLSETAPCIAASEKTVLTNRHGDKLMVCPRNGHWHTVSTIPFSLAGTQLAETGIDGRIDFSWSPDGTDFNAILRELVKEGALSIPTHTANFKRTLL